MTNPTMKVLLERGSCRSFLDKDVEDSLLAQVLEAGVRSASGGNLQPWSVIVIKEQETKDRLVDLCAGQRFIARAPVNLLFCIDFYRLKKWAELEVAPFTANRSLRHFWIAFQDTIISAQSICTAADAVGLGSVYVGTILDSLADFKELFDLPQGVLPVVLLCLGWPRAGAESRRKLPREILFHEEKYQKPSSERLLEAMDEKYNKQTFPLTEENLEKVTRVCNNVHSREFTEKCLAKIHAKGHINTAQRYFALHYNADRMIEGNKRYLDAFNDFGFTWSKSE